MVDARYETLGEVDERLAANAEYGKSAYPVNERLAENDWSRERIRWYQRAVPVGWLLVLVAFALLAVAFSIGLTLHEAYDAQVGMGMQVSPPPFNDLFESIHDLLAKSPSAWLWGVQNGSLHPSAWLWG